MTGTAEDVGGAGGAGLGALHRAAGAVPGRLRGVEGPRHYGDPAGEYRAATEEAAVMDRSGRGLLAVSGRDPGGMLSGVITGGLPPPLEEVAEGVLRGRAEGSALLTAKGRMVGVLRTLPAVPPWRRPGGDGGFLLDVPPEALPGVSAHLARFIPPRLASVEDRSGEAGWLTVAGPRAAELLSRDGLGLRVEAPELGALGEGDLVVVSAGGGDAVTVVRSAELASSAFDVLAGRDQLPALWRALVDGGARPAGFAVRESLRVEAGRPAFGQDMDDATIPVEAGVHGRLIDYGKGCFTGQEVVVRIRDRGHVNRHLRGLVLGDVPVPAAGTELFEPGGDRAVGVVTSAVTSPRWGGVVALGYVRREVSPPAVVRVGSPDGSEARVHDLDDDWPPGGADRGA